MYTSNIYIFVNECFIFLPLQRQLKMNYILDHDENKFTLTDILLEKKRYNKGLRTPRRFYYIFRGVEESPS